MNQPQFALDLREERLLSGDQPVRLTNKAFRLLQYFVQNPHRLLTKDAILDDLWPGVHVSEALIKEYVHDLRAALGDDSKRPEFIETVHGRGYRFHGGIDLVNYEVGASRSGTHRSGLPSVAVLPLENLAGGERWERVCHGICDDLITDLSRFPDLMVIAKNSSFAYKNDHNDVRKLGRELGASYVLEGSMQVSESQLRLNLQLVETQNGHHIWAHRHERNIGDLFSVQSDIVAEVASSLAGLEGQIPRAERLRLGRNPPQDLEAYELYLLGYELEERFEKQSVLRAFKLLRQAVDRDPNFARAWLVLGWACWQIAMEEWDSAPQDFRRIEREAFEKAATLDRLDALAIMELASVRAEDGDFTSARDGLERAFDLGQNQADLLAGISKYFATVTDEPERALRAIERGLQLNQNAPEWYFMAAARVSYFVGDFERAITYARQGPKNLPTQLFEVLSKVQLFGVDRCTDLIQSFRKRYPNFKALDFMKDPPITALTAVQKFMDGINKAGLH